MRRMAEVEKIRLNKESCMFGAVSGAVSVSCQVLRISAVDSCGFVNS